MSNIIRYIEEGGVYFITSVTSKRKPIFQEPKYANLLLSTIEYFKYYLEYIVYAYVIMPEHFHLLIQPSDKYNISKVMNYIKGNFSRRYNEINFTGRGALRLPYKNGMNLNDENDDAVLKKNTHPVWQKSFHDEIVRDENDFRNKIEYIHYNPVKAGIVQNEKDYPFSSYHQYQGNIRNFVQVAIEPFQ